MELNQEGMIDNLHDFPLVHGMDLLVPVFQHGLLDNLHGIELFGTKW